MSLDIAISLATATPVLGEFHCEHRHRVAVLSGESGFHTLQETAIRIAIAKGIDPRTLKGWLSFQSNLPQLADPTQLNELRRGIERDKVEAVIIDPLYLCLLSGSDVKAENLFQMGPLLLGVATACLEVGCTPFMNHHGIKSTAKKFDPLDLSDLAFSGVSEFARQWLLLSRRKAFVPGTGQHELHLVVGGSVGHSGLYAVDIDEGTLADDFTGRKWDVTIRHGEEARADERSAKADAKAEASRQESQRDDHAVLATLDKFAARGSAFGVEKLLARIVPPMGDRRLDRAIERLVAESIIERLKIDGEIGSGAIRKVKAIRRVLQSDRD